MGYYVYSFFPRSGFDQITQHISYRVVPEFMLAPAALNTIRIIIAFGTGLLLI